MDYKRRHELGQNRLSPISCMASLSLRNCFSYFIFYNMLNSIRKEILNLKANFRIKEGVSVKLDQNETPWDIPERIKEKILEDLRLTPFNRYPTLTEYHSIRKKLAEYINIDEDKLFISHGCDQIIFSFLLTFGGKGKKVLIFEPTYPLYRHFALLSGTEIKEVLLDEFYSIPREEADKLVKDVDLIIIANPNNPTGNLQNKEIIIKLMDYQIPILLDEAYFNYTGVTFAEYVESHENLVIGRSFSKVFLAGIRLGYSISSPRIREIFETINFTPFHLNHLNTVILKNIDLFGEWIEKKVQCISSRREELFKNLEEIEGVLPYTSFTNFILFRVENFSANYVYEKLIEKGVSIRDLSGVRGLSNHLRVTVGTEEENKIFLEKLQEVFYEGSERDF
ncbi:MAG: hypothetical protein DRQ03_07665 [Candidatus Hydrothermota bacterium]|nr:MAG: hypothetical protein DRQ03_07665 [Candidatus Hydrothermae bacterium]